MMVFGEYCLGLVAASEYDKSFDEQEAHDTTEIKGAFQQLSLIYSHYRGGARCVIMNRGMRINAFQLKKLLATKFVSRHVVGAESECRTYDSFLGTGPRRSTIYRERTSRLPIFSESKSYPSQYIRAISPIEAQERRAPEVPLKGGQDLAAPRLGRGAPGEMGQTIRQRGGGPGRGREGFTHGFHAGG